MMGRISVTYAVRSLLRYPRRTLLSMAGAGVGCGMGIMAMSWMGGAGEMQMRAASASGAGHLKVVPAGWTATRDNTLRLADAGEMKRIVRELGGVRGCSARARANGLLAFGTRSSGVEVVGVEPESEFTSNRIVNHGRLEGRYLRVGDSGKTVIGRALARRLKVRLDDDLYVTLAGKDEITSAMLNIVGILETGSRDLDAGICHIMLSDMESITRRPGPGEMAILLESPARFEDTRRELARRVGARNAVITWKEVMPELAANVEGDAAFTRILMAIIIVVVSLGIMSAQMTAVLERRRELAVLMALGMRGRRIVAALVAEAFLIGIGGALVSVALGGPVAWLLAYRGVDISRFMGGETSVGGVLLDPVMYGAFGWWIVWYGLGVSVAATVVATAYPAWFATRMKPAAALRVG